MCTKKYSRKAYFYRFVISLMLFSLRKGWEQECCKVHIICPYLDENFMNDSGHFEPAISGHFAEIRQIIVKHVWHAQTRQSISQIETLLQAKAWQLHLRNSSKTAKITVRKWN